MSLAPLVGLVSVMDQVVSRNLRQLWISMDFVDGQDDARPLAERFPAGMPLEQVVPIVKAVASALQLSKVISSHSTCSRLTMSFS